MQSALREMLLSLHWPSLKKGLHAVAITPSLERNLHAIAITQDMHAHICGHTREREYAQGSIQNRCAMRWAEAEGGGPGTEGVRTTPRMVATLKGMGMPNHVAVPPFTACTYGNSSVSTVSTEVPV